MSSKFMQLAHQALNSGKLSSESRATLLEIMRVRQYNSTEIDLFSEPERVVEVDPPKFMKIDEYDPLMYEVFLLIYNRLAPDDLEQNERAAKASASSGDGIYRSDLKQIFGEHVKYVSLEHLKFLLSEPQLPKFETVDDAIVYIKKNVIDGKLHATRATIQKWLDADRHFDKRVIEHVFYWNKKLSR